MTKAIMIIWMGIGQAQVLTTEKFDTEAECEAAKAGIVMHYNGKWSSIIDSDIECVSYKVSE